MRVPRSPEACAVSRCGRSSMNDVDTLPAASVAVATRLCVPSARVTVAVQRPELYYATNVLGGLNLINAMNKCSVRYFIFSSTCATYGIPAHVPIDE